MLSLNIMNSLIKFIYLKSIFFILASVVGHYFLLKLFLQEHYLFYFLGIVLYIYLILKSLFLTHQKNLYILLLSVFLFSLLFEFFDNEIFDLYLYTDMEKYYSFVGGEVGYILTLLHCIMIFLGYNRKKYL